MTYVSAVGQALKRLGGMALVTLMATGWGSSLYAAAVIGTITVKDNNGAAINGAAVVCMTFGSSGPSGTGSVLGTTDASGQASLTLDDTLNYQCAAAATSYRPNLRDQMMGFGGSGPASPSVVFARSYTLKQESNIANIVVGITAAKGTSAKLVMVELRGRGVPEASAFGVGQVAAGTGNQSLNVTIYGVRRDIPPGDINVFDPATSKGASYNLTDADLTSLRALADGGILTIAGPIDLTASTALAPQSVDDSRYRVEGGRTGIPSLNVQVLDTSGTQLSAEIRVKNTCSGPYVQFAFGKGLIPVYGLSGTGPKCIDVLAVGVGGVNNQTTPSSTDWTATTTNMAVTITPSTGTIAFQIQANGTDVPAGAMIEPDFIGQNYWVQITSHPCATINLGATRNFLQADDGTGTFTGVSDGRYVVRANPAFGGGETNNYPNNGQPGSADDKCIAVVNSALKIYNRAGTDVTPSPAKLVMALPVQIGTTGSISGTAKFPRGVTLPGDTDGKCTIMAFPSFQTSFSSTPPQVGFAALTTSGTAKQEVPFTIQAKAGTVYFIEPHCTKFGVIQRGADNRADLSSVSAITGKVIEFGDSGTAKFRLFKPDGSPFKPTNVPEPGQDPTAFAFSSAFVNVMCLGSFGHAQVTQTGEAIVTGLLPGTCNAEVSGSGSGWTYAVSPVTDLRVNVGQTTTVNITLKNGVALRPAVTGTLPTPTDFTPGVLQREVKLLGFTHGESFGPDNIEKLVGFRDSAGFILRYGRFGGPQGGTTPTWEIKRDIPEMKDYYLMEQVHFAPPGQGGTPVEPKEYTRILGKAIRFAVDGSKATTTVQDPFGPPNQTVKVQEIPITIAANQTAALTVNVTASRFLDDQAIKEIAGDKIDKMFGYIPKFIVLNAKDGSLLGAGVSVPVFTGLTQDAFGKMDGAIKSGDASTFNEQMKRVSMRCTIEGLPAGEVLVVGTSIVYPTLVHPVTLVASTNTVVAMNFDSEIPQVGTIQGTVTDKSSGAKLANAIVRLKHKAMNKKAITGSDGAYSFIGLPLGRFGVDVQASGYEAATDVVVITSSASATVNFPIRAAPGSATVRVLASRFPFTRGLPDQKCLMYNETLNTQTGNTKPPAILKTRTDDTGTANFTGLVAGDRYKVHCVTEGKGVMSQTITATAGTVAGDDFVVALKAPEVRMHCRVSPLTGLFECLIQSPKPLNTITASYTAGATFDTSASATAVTLTSAPVPNTWTFSMTPPTTAITFRVKANDGSKDANTDYPANPNNKGANIVKSAEEKAIQGESIPLDEDDKGGSSCEFPAGVVTFSTTTTPTVTLTKTSTSSVTGTLPSGGSYAGDPVTVKNEGLALATGKKVLLSFPCDPKAGSADRFALYQLLNGTWTKVAVSLSVDPLAKVCEAEVQSISNAALAASMNLGPTSDVKLARQLGLSAVKNGEFVHTSADDASTTGTFSILVAAEGATTQGSAYTGTSLNAYNFPNPFNLTTKTLTLASGGASTSLSTNGTIIRYDLPSANTGKVIIRIYTLAGELVRVLDDGDKTGGFTYYATWDGKNKDGENVASGVYFAVFDVPGQKPKDHTVKMAVLK